jgi:uncharacterized protein (TIGR01244 family)
MKLRIVFAALTSVTLVAALHAQAQVTRETVDGVTNFARLQTTVACAGATQASAVPDIKKMGFASIINLREATEQGAKVDEEAAAAKAAGITFIHLPLNVASPAPDVVDRFLASVSAPANQPAFIHCAGGGRAAGMWMLKRVLVDQWDEPRALEEATALGLNDRMKPFVLNYIAAHKR